MTILHPKPQLTREDVNARFPWRAALATAVLATFFFGFTLTTAVPVWTDESIIVELGRVALSHETSALSFHERSDSGRPVHGLSPLSAVVAELAFRVGAPSNLGVRVLALWGQLAAAAFFIYYLRLRGVAISVAILLGLAFFLDPLCDMSWRAGRVDGWTFALLFASLCAIRGTRRSRDPHAVFWGAMLAGVAAATGFLWWPSFVMLVPLLILEVPEFVKEQPRALRAACLFAGGAVVTLAAFVLFFRQEIGMGLADGRFMTVLQSQQSWSGGLGRQWIALISITALTPVAASVGIAALFRRRNHLLLVGFLIAFVITLATMISRSRVLYLVPYFYLAVSSIFWHPSAQPDQSRWRRVGVWAITFMLMLGVAFTAIGTTMSGLSNRAGKDPMILLEPARSAIGMGAIRVFLYEPDLYYVARTLGWQQFHCFDACWGPEPASPMLRGMLSGLDVAVFRGEPDKPMRALIEETGFHFQTVILPGGGHRSSLFGWSYGPPTYGPYFIYRR
jgi:hypothetical protein